MRVNPLFVLGISLTCLSPAGAEAPLNAIDWLNQPAPVPVIQSKPHAPQNPLPTPPVAKSATVPDVSVSPLDMPKLDAVGLLPSSVSGLPATLWKTSETAQLARLLTAQRVDTMPALQALLYTLILTEAAAPQDAGQGTPFLAARIDTLIGLGAVEAAEALLERTGRNTPALFSRWFDASLLTGTEDAACDVMRARSSLAPSYAARVFCAVRGGDWTTAALTLDTARALNLLSGQEEALLSRFLEPDGLEDQPLPLPPVRPSPLVFRLREAIGEPLPTAPLPRAFAVADLRDTAGWKAQLEAAERLARTGALQQNQLLGLYSERLPAASGGIWDRVEAIQRFDTAISSGDPGAIARSLPRAWAAMQAARLEDPFARLYGDALMRLPLTGAAASLAYRIALVGPQYEKAANLHGADQPDARFLTGIAKGAPETAVAQGEVERAIAAGFADLTLPADLVPLVKEGRLGEAILTNMLLFQQAAGGETKDLARALTGFRALGLEDTARRAALQLLLLRRGA